MALVSRGSPSLFDQILAEVAYLSSFSYSAISSIISTKDSHNNLKNGRPDWGLYHTLLNRLIKGSTDFKGHSIQRIKFWDRLSSLSVIIIPWSVRCIPFEFSVNLEVLLEEEQRRKVINPYIYSTIYTMPSELNPKAHLKLNGEWVSWGPDNQLPRDSKVVLYLHGGGYFAGSHITHRHLTWRYAKETNTRIFVINYRLAPDDPFPAALHDVYAAYLYLVNPTHRAFQQDSFFSQNKPNHHPINPKNITLMGDSAGGGLCLALIAYMKDFLDILPLPTQILTNTPTNTQIPINTQMPTNTKIPNNNKINNNMEKPLFLPKAAILISPWCELGSHSESHTENQHHDYIPQFKFFDNLYQESMNPAYWYTVGHASPSVLGKRNWFVNNQESRHEEEDASLLVQHPFISPLYVPSFDGFPPILIQAGDAEVFRDETLFLAHKIWCSNGKGFVRHELYKNMSHVFPILFWLDTAVVSYKSIRLFHKWLYDGVASLMDEDQEVFTLDLFKDRHQIPRVASVEVKIEMPMVEGTRVDEQRLRLDEKQDSGIFLV